MSPPTAVSTSLAADLEGLTLTDSPLVPSVRGQGRAELHPVVRPWVEGCGGRERLGPLLLDDPHGWGQGWGRLPVAHFCTPPHLPPPQLLSPVSGVGRQELLHRVAGEGLAVDYTFSRQPFPGDPHMVSLHIHFSNSSETPIKGLHMGTPKLPAGIGIQEFPEIGAAPGKSQSFCGCRGPSVPGQGPGSGGPERASRMVSALVGRTEQ